MRFLYNSKYRFSVDHKVFCRFYVQATENADQLQIKRRSSANILAKYIAYSLVEWKQYPNSSKVCVIQYLTIEGRAFMQVLEYLV